VTGIAALVLSYIASRRVRAYKTLDLRLEVRKGYSDLNTLLKQELPSLLDCALNSRVAVATARGFALGGGFEAWKTSVRNDLAAVQALARELPDTHLDYRDSNVQELESKLVEINAMKRRATALHDKYRGELEADDRDRDRIREAHEASMRPRH